MMHVLQAQVCGCSSARPGYQKTKQETSDTSKSQLNQAIEQESFELWLRKSIKRP